MSPAQHDDSAARRYARHLSLEGFGAVGQERLRAARVLVVGAGGLGSPVIAALAGSGVGRLVVVDPDVVELSNLPRQLIHTEVSIGEAKVTSAARAVAASNSDVEVVAVRRRLDVALALELVADVDVVVDCSDSVEARYVLNDACVLLGVPLAWASIAQFAGQFGVVEPGVGPCYRCLFPDPRAVAGTATCEQAGVLGVLPGVVGMMQAVEVVKVCAGIGEVASRAVRLYDALTASMTALPVARDLDCRVCGRGEGFFDGVDGVDDAADGVVGGRDDGASAGADGDGAASEFVTIGASTWPRAAHVVVDVRGDGEAAATALPAWMIAGADATTRVEWGSGWSPETRERVAAWAAGRDIVLVCAQGRRSRAAARSLVSALDPDARVTVMSVSGGLNGIDAR